MQKNATRGRLKRENNEHKELWGSSDDQNHWNCNSIYHIIIWIIHYSSALSALTHYRRRLCSTLSCILLGGADCSNMHCPSSAWVKNMRQKIIAMFILVEQPITMILRSWLDGRCVFPVWLAVMLCSVDSDSITSRYTGLSVNHELHGARSTAQLQQCCYDCCY